jgi:flagellum-specific peptidoglycan hydrolase FlgJ
MLPESNNLFNIKWKGNEEEIMQRLNIEIRKKTYYVWEIINGKKIYLYQDFRVYQTILDSIIDYIDYIKHKTDMDIYKRFGFKPREYYQ